MADLDRCEESFHTKWMYDGCGSFQDMIKRTEANIEYVRRRKEEGWEWVGDGLVMWRHPERCEAKFKAWKAAKLADREAGKAE